MDLSLRPGLHYCVANGRTALLDVTHDRYLALPDTLDLAFQAMVKGTEAGLIDASPVDALIAQGVLLRSDAAVPWPSPAQLPRPTGSFVDMRLEDRVDPWMFARAYLTQRRASNGAPGLRLPVIVDEIRADLAAIGPARTLPPGRRAFQALRSYLSTRWLISTHDQCLMQSATLFHFLARYGWRPRFVVAVRMAPFAAHAWLQEGEIVLNDRLDHVLPYTPILVL